MIKRSQWYIYGLSLLLILFFQNCRLITGESTGPQSVDGIEKSIGRTANGEPYSGKVSYLEIEIGHYCKDQTGQEVPSPKSILVEQEDHTFVKTFENCEEVAENVPATEVKTVEGGALPMVTVGQKVYRHFQTPPNLAVVEFPHYFCFEQKVKDLVQTQATGTFYEFNILGSYQRGRWASLIKRSIVGGQYQTGFLSLYESANLFQSLLDGIIEYWNSQFNLSIDSNRSEPRVGVLQPLPTDPAHEINYTLFEGLGSYQSSVVNPTLNPTGDSTGSPTGSADLIENSPLYCSLIPALPLYLRGL